MANQNAFDSIIWQKAKIHAVDPILIKSIVASESSFDPRAYRGEPQINDASYGLMQTLYRTAKGEGYTGTPEGLFDPSTSIEYGTRYIKRQLLRYKGNVPSAVAAYNSGTAYYKADGSFVNQPYVDRVFRFYERFKGQREAETDPGVLLRSDLPQLGPIPSSPRGFVDIPLPSVVQSVGDAAASFIESDSAPWLIAIGGAMLLAALSPSRR